MTRALALLARGEITASFRMHALAVPAALAGLLVAASSAWATWTTGSPSEVHRTLLGRCAIGAVVVVYVATIVLWGARTLGAFGGPVAV
jgi:hypothetical protein